MKHKSNKGLLITILAVLAASVMLFATACDGGGTTPQTEDTYTSYTVTFNSDGGSNVASKPSSTATGKVTKPADPTKEGFDFAGWFTDGGGAFDFDAVITENITLTAQWTKAKFVGGEGVTYTLIAGTAFEALAQASSGTTPSRVYIVALPFNVFEVWSNNPKAGANPVTGSSGNNRSAGTYAISNVDGEVTITFTQTETRGASQFPTGVESLTATFDVEAADADNNITSFSIENMGFRWPLAMGMAPVGGNGVDESNQPLESGRFTFNSHSVAADVSEIEYGFEAGTAFEGLVKVQETSTKVYIVILADGEFKIISTNPVSGTLRSTGTYEITNNDGAVEVAFDQSTIGGTGQSWPASMPIYTFTADTVSASNKITSFSIESGTFRYPTSMGSTVANAVAEGERFAFNPYTFTSYTATFDSDEGSEVADIASSTATGKITKPADPVRDGFDFAGWFTGAGAEFDFGAAIADNITLTAHWIARYEFIEGTAFEALVKGSSSPSKVYIVILEGNGFYIRSANPVSGTLRSTGTYEITNNNDAVEVAFDQSTIGGTGGNWPASMPIYTFTVDTASATNKVISFSIESGTFRYPTSMGSTVANAVEEGARFVFNSYTFTSYTATFDSDGGSAVNPIMSSTATGRIAKPENPTKDGLDFAGWYTDAGAKFDFNTGISGDITLTAHWDDKHVGTYGTAYDVQMGSTKVTFTVTIVLKQDGTFTYSSESVMGDAYGSGTYTLEGATLTLSGAIEGEGDELFDTQTYTYAVTSDSRAITGGAYNGLSWPVHTFVKLPSDV